MNPFEEIQKMKNIAAIQFAEDDALAYFGLKNKEEASTLPVEKKKEIFNFLCQKFFEYGGKKIVYQ